MPITIQDVTEHRDFYGIGDVQTMMTGDYRQALAKEAFFWIDHHDFLRSTLSGEILAVNREQLDLLIEHLSSLRNKMA